MIKKSHLSLAVLLTVSAGCYYPNHNNNNPRRAYIPAPADENPTEEIIVSPTPPITDSIIAPPSIITSPIIVTTVKPVKKELSSLPILPPPPIKVEKPKKPKVIEYKIVKGDYLGKIGKKFNIDYRAIAKFNNIPLTKILYVDQVLRIPLDAKKFVPIKRRVVKKTVIKTKTKRESLPTDGIYKVQKGDSISKIAVKFGVKQKDIFTANNLKDINQLQVGQKLVIPGASGITKTTPKVEKKAEKVESNRIPNIIAPKAVKTTIIEEPIIEPETDIGTGIQILPPADETPMEIDEPASEDIEINLKEGASVEDLNQYSIVDAAEGDTFSSMADDYTCSAEDIKKLNPNISAEEPLKEGQKIKVPAFN